MGSKEEVNAVVKIIRREFYPKVFFTASDIYLSGWNVGDLPLYDALERLEATGEIRALVDNPKDHNQMKYQVINNEL